MSKRVGSKVTVPVELTDQETFFFNHAGFSVGQGETKREGQVRSARELARAETYGQEHGWTYKWDWDQDADLSFMSEEERAQDHECLYCLLLDADGNTLESLSGIIDADKAYGRVVEAELASEELAGIEREARMEKECSDMMGGCK